MSISENVDVDEAIELLKGVTKFPSFSGEETPVTEYLAGFLEDNGIEVEIMEVEPGRKQLLGRIRGTGEGPSLMFNGHTDVDPVNEFWRKKGKPFDAYLENGTLFGHGIANMKSGTSAMIMAAVQLAREKVKLKGDLLIAVVVGELQGGFGTKFIVDKGIIPDYAIVPEPSGLNIRTATAGVMNVLVHTIGKSAHIGRMDIIKSINAIEKMCKVIETLKQVEFTYEPKTDLPGLPRYSVGTIIGGISREYKMWRPAYLPDFCTIQVDVRTVEGQTDKTVIKDFTKVLDEAQKIDPDIKYEIEPSPTALYMPPCYTPVDSKIVKVVEKNHVKVTGRQPESIGALPPQSYAGNDSGHLFNAGTEAVTYGPSDMVANLYGVEVEKYVTCIKVLIKSAVDLLK